MAEYRVTLNADGVNQDFLFVGGPVDDLAGSANLFGALGYACAQWSRMEQHIDAILMHINNRDHSEAIYNPDHPVSFSKKIGLLKKWFNRHPALKVLAEDVRILTSKLKTLNPHRNNLIHGVIESFDSETKTATFRTLKFMDNDEFKLTSHNYTLEAIMTVAELASMSNGYLARISEVVFTRETLLQLKKA